MSKKDLVQKIKTLDNLTQQEKAYLVELINAKKYGLVWENKPEKVEQQLKQNLPILKEVKEKYIKGSPLTPKGGIIQNEIVFAPPLGAGGQTFAPPLGADELPNHILIEGDNLHALTALSFTHENKIDVIYIDPPYNTGNKDFKYNDSFVDKEDTYRHSKWLSFMSKRLQIAKKLLNENGVIFCSIGNDEIAQLTLLFNEIYGEINQLGIVSRIQKKGSDKGNYFSPSIDYILAFSKNKSLVANFVIPVSAEFKKIEKEGNRKGEFYEDSKSLYQSSLDSRPNQRYYILCPDGSFVIPPGNVFPTEIKDASFVKPINNNDKCWRWAYESYLIQKDLLVFKKTKKSPLVDEKGNPAVWNVYTKRYKIDAEKKGNVPSNLVDNCYNSLGTNALSKLDIDFSFAKPVELLKYLFSISKKETKNAIILDFFAGSGTTLHATMALNAEDGGNRQCILVTNNENNICEEVTYERNKRVIEGYNNAKGIFVEGLGANNLRYYQCGFVSSEETELNKRHLTQASSELLSIKENCFEDITVLNGFLASDCQVFTNSLGKYLVIVYHSREQAEVCEALVAFIQDLEISERVKVYGFSPEREVLEDDFAEVLEKIVAIPLPEAIRNTYKATFKILKFDRETEISENDTPTSVGDLFG